MKTIQIDLSARTNKKPISDGAGGQHADGAVVQLPDEIADALIGLKVAFPVDGSSLIAAQAAAKERAEADRVQRIKVAAMRQMQVHDSLPPEVRAMVHEHGDEVTEQYLAHVREQDALHERPPIVFGHSETSEPVRRRDRHRKHRKFNA